MVTTLVFQVGRPRFNSLVGPPTQDLKIIEEKVLPLHALNAWLDVCIFLHKDVKIVVTLDPLSIGQ